VIAGLIARLRSLVRGFRKGDDLYTEMSQEFQAHIEMRAEDLAREGLTTGEALRRARLEFGSTEMHKDAGRESRGLRPFDTVRVSWLDFKLGFRMLGRYPGLTLVGGLAMAFGIWVGAGMFEIIGQVLHPKLPLPNADRLVALQLVDSRGGGIEDRTLFDFARWRGRLQTVRDLGVYNSPSRNLIIGQGIGEPTLVGVMSASGFRVAGIRPMLGRTLVDADEAPGAPPAIVLGHQVWRSRFRSDSSVLGQVVRLGRDPYQIVGIMPEGFAFPISHQAWIPFPVPGEGAAPRQGPEVRMFGALAPGASLETANAELALIGQRTAADYRVTHERLRPRVLEYAKSFWDIPTGISLAILSSNLVVIMLLVLICSNVALLMFARAATREAEIAVRTALGASRARIVTQLFAEALVLGGIAAAIGLLFAGSGMRWALGMVKGELLGEFDLPFWFSGRLSPSTLVYTLALTLLAAAIAGVLPALKITRGIGERLKQTSSGRVTFGGIWTAVIITQVALTVAFPVVALFVRRDSVQIQTLAVDFPSEQFLSVRPQLDRNPGIVTGDSSLQAYRGRVDSTLRAFEQRLLGEPGVLGVTATDHLPRSDHGWNDIEVDDSAVPPDERVHRISSAAVDPDYFTVLDAPVLSGRGFSESDVGSDARPAIVNTVFVKKVLGGKNPLGRRIRYLRGQSPRAPKEPPGPWHDIVGVVGDLGTKNGYGLSGVYHPFQPTREDRADAYFAIRVRGEPGAFMSRVRALAAAVDPTLRLHELKPLDRVVDDESRFYDFLFHMTLLVAGFTLVLSLAGVYSVMAFTVSRRTREIGIRVAMGAVPRQIIPVILRRPLRQVAFGILAGGVLVWWMSNGGVKPELVLDHAVEGLDTLRGGVWIRTALLTAGYSVLMMGVCLLACIVPTRRALRVEPTEALRGEG